MSCKTLQSTFGPACQAESTSFSRAAVGLKVAVGLHVVCLAMAWSWA